MWRDLNATLHTNDGQGSKLHRHFCALACFNLKSKLTICVAFFAYTFPVRKMDILCIDNILNAPKSVIFMSENWVNCMEYSFLCGSFWFLDG